MDYLVRQRKTRVRPSSTEPELKMTRPLAIPTSFPSAGLPADPVMQPLASESPLPELFDAPFQRWLEAHLQRWTDVAVALGEARWSCLGGLRSRYY
jgi:hypothetical protein